MRLDEVEVIENSLRELDRSAQVTAEGRDPRSVGSRNAELYARYAADTAKWLTDQIQKRRLGDLEVFASLRLLTLLRSMYSVTARELIHEHSVKLHAESLRELERHPALVQAIQERLGRGSKRAS